MGVYKLGSTYRYITADVDRGIITIDVRFGWRPEWL